MIPNYEYHEPVLLDETIKGLGVKFNGSYLDCTLGGGGHFKKIVKTLGEEGIAIGIDKDPEAIEWVKEIIKNENPKVILEQSQFSDFDKVLREHSIASVDGILLDLGVSSKQIDDEKRGFSYKFDVKLDMRMNPNDKISAKKIIELSNEEKLTDILKNFGEIGNPRRMARTIKQYYQKNGMTTSNDLQKCLEEEYGSPIKYKVLAKVFQALRIAVNNELDELKICLHKSIQYLNKGGRLVIIAYHSLEDRIVKNFIRDNERTCICDQNEPICKCTRTPIFKRVNKKVYKATDSEIMRNCRSRSAKLRIAEKVI